jgi:hypothetical protein
LIACVGGLLVQLLFEPPKERQSSYGLDDAVQTQAFEGDARGQRARRQRYSSFQDVPRHREVLKRQGLAPQDLFRPDGEPGCLCADGGYLLAAACFLPSQVPFSFSVDQLPESASFFSFPVMR